MSTERDGGVRRVTSEDTAGRASTSESAGGRRSSEEAGPATEPFDGGIVDVVERLLSTETRARIYVYLRKHPGRTSDEVGRGTGLYPSTVRETLAAMTEEGILSREKRENDGAGNNPYEYTAIPPSALVRKLVGDLQDDLNTLCNLDHHLAGRRPADSEPVRIEVRGSDGDE